MWASEISGSLVFRIEGESYIFLTLGKIVRERRGKASSVKKKKKLRKVLAKSKTRNSKVKIEILLTSFFSSTRELKWKEGEQLLIIFRRSKTRKSCEIVLWLKNVDFAIETIFKV